MISNNNKTIKYKVENKIFELKIKEIKKWIWIGIQLISNKFGINVLIILLYNRYKKYKKRKT